MKILYVNPARLNSGMDAIITGSPLSLATIAAMVPEHKATLFDFKVDKYKESKFRELLSHSDVVAITSLTPQIYSAFEVAEMAKEHDCITIIGGYHATLAPDFVAAHEAVDFVIRGEGEHTYKELIDFIDNNKNNITIEDIDGLSYKDSNGNVIHNNERHLECDLDSLPCPKREMFDGKLYSYMGARTQQLETSRGCPHNCKFCSIIKMWRNSDQKTVYRTKSVKRVMQEVYDVDRKNNDFIFFCDDNFTINVKRTKKILDAIIRSGIQKSIYFSCQSRIDTLYNNPWLIDKLHEAGFRQVFLGIESVHQQSLDAMGKVNTTPFKAKVVIKKLRDLGISIFGGIIIGYPGETKRMVRQNIQYANELELDCAQFTPITAFPGTPFFEEMKEMGRIQTENYIYYDLFHPMMKTEELTAKEMYELVMEAYASFYLGSGWIFRRGKEYLNPFGRFQWMFNSLGRLIKQMVFGGLTMLWGNGIKPKAISKELKRKKLLMKEINENFRRAEANALLSTMTSAPKKVKEKA